MTGSDIDAGTTVTANGLSGIKHKDGKDDKKVFKIPATATAKGGDLVLEISSPTGVTLSEAWLQPASA